MVQRGTLTGRKPADSMRVQVKGFATPYQQVRGVSRPAVRADGQEMSSGRRIIIVFQSISTSI
jgi:hypothetical protein